MNQTRLNFIPILLGTLLVWYCAQAFGYAQKHVADPKPPSTDYPRVEWVKNWPSADNKKTKKKFKDQFNAVLFGIKAPVLNNPVAVLANSPDDFWILDQGNKTVFRVQKGVGDIPHSIAKSDLDLSSLVGICFGPNSSILFTDSKAQKVFRIMPEKKKLGIVNDTMTLEQPTGIAYSSVNKEIWVIESKAHRIAVLSENGELIKRIGSRGNAPGEFNYPTHIWIDAKGNIYINDAMNFRIQVLNPDGEVISVFGEAGDASGYLARPKGIATDSFGNIYVVDAVFHVVQVFDLKGNFLYTFGNQGHGNGEFWMPSGIFIDSLDNIYVADTYNSRIQVFKLIYTEIK
jgi:DNA-binding beta-propeller fold protein YncE